MRIAYRKNICPPGLRYLKIFVATASILSGCIADSTNIAVTISENSNNDQSLALLISS